MKLHEYYGNTADRMEAWKDQALDPGFAPCRDLIDLARPFLKTGGRVLDIGCQGGHQLALIAGGYEEAHGLDVARYDEIWATVPRAKFVVGDVDSSPLPYPDEYFDCILCTMVLEHVFDVFGLARELARTLACGGTCLLAVPNIAFFRHIISLLRGRVPRTGANEIPFSEKQGWDGQHLHYYTHREVAWLLNRNGIEITATLFPGKLPALKSLCPRLLSSSIVVVGTKLRAK
jgi:SAM-dependent methyltransferase